MLTDDERRNIAHGFSLAADDFAAMGRLDVASYLNDASVAVMRTPEVQRRIVRLCRHSARAFLVYRRLLAPHPRHDYADEARRHLAIAAILRWVGGA
mgnify:FL=1